MFIYFSTTVKLRRRKNIFETREKPQKSNFRIKCQTSEETVKLLCLLAQMYTGKLVKTPLFVSPSVALVTKRINTFHFDRSMCLCYEREHSNTPGHWSGIRERAWMRTNWMQAKEWIGEQIGRVKKKIDQTKMCYWNIARLSSDELHTNKKWVDNKVCIDRRKKSIITVSLYLYYMYINVRIRTSNARQTHSTCPHRQWLRRKVSNAHRAQYICTRSTRTRCRSNKPPNVCSQRMLEIKKNRSHVPPLHVVVAAAAAVA